MSKNPRLPPYNLTKKEKDYADQLIETGSSREAALRAYDCSTKESASQIAYKNSKNVHIQSYINAMLQLNNTVGKAVSVLDDAMAAKVNHQGEETELPDHNVRIKASKQILDIAIPKESSPKKLHLEKHQHTHFSFGDDVPQIVLEWIVEHQGRWPTESEWKRIINGESI